MIQATYKLLISSKSWNPACQTRQRKYSRPKFSRFSNNIRIWFRSSPICLSISYWIVKWMWNWWILEVENPEPKELGRKTFSTSWNNLAFYSMRTNFKTCVPTSVCRMTSSTSRKSTSLSTVYCRTSQNSRKHCRSRDISKFWNTSKPTPLLLIKSKKWWGRAILGRC